MGVYALTIGGTLANGDKIIVCGVETILNSTSAASGTAAAAAVKTSLDNNAAVSAKYTIANSSSNVITFTEKSGHYGDGKPSAIPEAVVRPNTHRIIHNEEESAEAGDHADDSGR